MYVVYRPNCKNEGIFGNHGSDIVTSYIFIEMSKCPVFGCFLRVIHQGFVNLQPTHLHNVGAIFISIYNIKGGAVKRYDFKYG